MNNHWPSGPTNSYQIWLIILVGTVFAEHLNLQIADIKSQKAPQNLCVANYWRPSSGFLFIYALCQGFKIFCVILLGWLLVVGDVLQIFFTTLSLYLYSKYFYNSTDHRLTSTRDTWDNEVLVYWGIYQQQHNISSILCLLIKQNSCSTSKFHVMRQDHLKVGTGLDGTCAYFSVK